MFRLVAYAPDGVRRFPVLKSESVLGSQPECDIYLPYPGVAPRHAVLRYDGMALRIEDVGGSRKLEIVAKNNAPENKYIQSVMFNGKGYDRSWFPHSAIANGGNIVFEMGPKPNLQFGSTEDAMPPSMGGAR